MKALGLEVRGHYKHILSDTFEIQTGVDTAPAAAEITVRGQGIE